MDNPQVPKIAECTRSQANLPEKLDADTDTVLVTITTTDTVTRPEKAEHEENEGPSAGEQIKETLEEAGKYIGKVAK